jgi:uroporphyrinogen III methyltransferase/synthase
VTVALAGKTVLVTRAREDAQALVTLVEAAGGRAALLPCIELAGPSDRGPLDAELARLRAGHWPDLIAFASPHAVRRFFAELGAGPAAARALLAAVGEGTAQVLRELGAASVITPSEGAGAEALLASLPSVRDLWVLLPRAEEATPDLADGLRARGAAVEAVALYRTIPATSADPDGAAALRAGRVDAIAFASGSAARGFAKLFGPEAAALAARCAVACMGRSCAEAARTAGLRVDAVGDGGLAELVRAVAEALERR